MNLTASSLQPHDLERDGLPSLHEQLSDQLRQFALTAQRGERLPTEGELTSMFGVSRVTVRRAIETLVREGLLVRIQGRGTFVGRQRVQTLDRLRPFVATFEDDGDVETQLVEFGWKSGEDAPDALQNDDVLAFRRLYSTDGSPHALVDVYLPKRIGAQITRNQLEAHPIYHVLQNSLEIELREAQVRVSSGSATADVAQLLGLPAAHSLLMLERTTLDVDGEIVEVARHHLMPDIYQLQLTVNGSGLPPLIRLPHGRSENQ